jgi:hypothetical protein
MHVPYIVETFCEVLPVSCSQSTGDNHQVKKRPGSEITQSLPSTINCKVKNIGGITFMFLNIFMALFFSTGKP